jgi:hypothetical protein
MKIFLLLIFILIKTDNFFLFQINLIKKKIKYLNFNKMSKREYNMLDEDLLKILTDKFNKYLINKKNKILTDKRNIKKNIGRPRKISIKNVIIYAFKVINGSKLTDLINNQKELSSYQKYIRELKTSNILSNLFKKKIIELNKNKELDLNGIHIDSTDILNINGTEDVAYGYKLKNKKASRIHLAISNNEIPLAVHITGANVSDTTQLETTMSNIPFKLKSSNKKPIYVMLDKGYLSKKNFDIIENNYKCKMLCPLKNNTNLKQKHNKELFNRFKRKNNQERYNDRLKIERFFALTKKSRLIQLRYDRKKIVFLGTILLILLNITFIRAKMNK